MKITQGKNQQDIPRPTPEVAKRIEELLQEQLYELGVNVKNLKPEEIAKSMKCHIAPDNSMTYYWNNHAILDVIPEIQKGTQFVKWRMFTKDDIQKGTE